LSTGQIGRLTGEFKSMASQNEEFKKIVQEQEARFKNFKQEADNKVQILTQEC
jgi:Sec-independent protein translocase protein TatA